MKLASLSTITLLTTFFSLASSLSAQAEIRQPGVVLETACAKNSDLPSEITQICFAQVVGLKGEFMTTRAVDGTTRVWKVTKRVEASTNEQCEEARIDNLELVSLGVIRNRFLDRADNAEILTANLREATFHMDGSIEIEGSVGNQPLLASNFETFLFTMGHTFPLLTQ